MCGTVIDILMLNTGSPGLVKMNHLRRILPYLPEIGTPAFRAKLVDLFPHEGVQEMKRFIDTMYRRSVEIYREKVHALELGDEVVAKQVGEGKDIISILSLSALYLTNLVGADPVTRLVRANMAAAEDDRLPEKEVIAQISYALISISNNGSC